MFVATSLIVVDVVSLEKPSFFYIVQNVYFFDRSPKLRLLTMVCNERLAALIYPFSDQSIKQFIDFPFIIVNLSAKDRSTKA